MKRRPLVPILLAFVLFGATTFVQPQENEQASTTPGQPPQAQPAPQQVWSAEQLDNLVAPVALYPDPLLGQVLVASTYPLEVVEASQWLQRNRNLRGQALVDAAKQQPWDASIQALVAVPDALAKLNQDIRWTTDLGNAFLSQQAEVMNAVQRLRARAQASGRLSSTPQQTVRTQAEGGQQVIIIQPAEPEVIYVPTYDPFYIWGPPVYGYYPPLYYPTFGFGFGIGFNLGFCFGNWGGWGFWGWGPSWFGHSIYVNDYFFHRYGFHGHYGHHGYGYRGRTEWVHDPGHRMHVPYGNDRVAARFGGRTMGPRNSFQPGTGSRGAASAYTNRSQERFARRTGEQGYRGASPQAQGNRNPPRQYGGTSQVQGYQSQPRQGYQSSGQSQSSTRQYGGTSQAQGYQSQARQSYQSSGQSQSSPRQYGGTSQVQGYQSQPRQSYQSSQRYQSSPRQYGGTSQVQGYQSQARQSFQAPRQYSSAPQVSAPRFSGGGSRYSRGSGSSFSRGGGTSFSHGGGGGFSRGAGSSSRGGGGGSRHR